MSGRVLVTGGAGFIGCHLCKSLLNAGYHVICVDNFFTGHKDNILNFCSNPNFEFILHDVTEPVFCDVEYIYNLACPASPAHYQRDPVKTSKISVLGALHVLDLAQKTGAKILQASTSEIYGDPLVHPQKESYYGNVNPIGPRACYDEGKRMAETLFFDYYRQYQLDIRVARIFNTYGPYMSHNDGRVVSNFIVQALRNEDLTIYGDGLQTRSFCYVDDLIRGLISLMENSRYPGPYNIGNPTEISIRGLAEKIIVMTDSHSGIVFRNLPENDPVKRKPDISKISEELGWKPKISLEDGLASTIRYFKKVLI